MKKYNPKIISLMTNCFACGNVTTKKHKLDNMYLCEECNSLNPVELYDLLTDTLFNSYNITDEEMDKALIEIFNNWDED